MRLNELIEKLQEIQKAQVDHIANNPTVLVEIGTSGHTEYHSLGSVGPGKDRSSVILKSAEYE